VTLRIAGVAEVSKLAIYLATPQVTVMDLEVSLGERMDEENTGVQYTGGETTSSKRLVV